MEYTSNPDALLTSFDVNVLKAREINLPCFLLANILIQQELELIKENKNKNGNIDLCILINNEIYVKRNYMKNDLKDIFKILDVSGRKLYFIEELNKDGIKEVTGDFLLNYSRW